MNGPYDLVRWSRPRRRRLPRSAVFAAYALAVTGTLFLVYLSHGAFACR